MCCILIRSSAITDGEKNTAGQAVGENDHMPPLYNRSGSISMKISHISENRIGKGLIALCGMDCRLCLAFEREKNGCCGCRAKKGKRFDSTDRCKIRNCTMAVKGKLIYCHACASYPCKRITHIDERYRTRYGMSMIDNLESIKRSGIREFLRREEKRWVCPECGKILCVHRPQCLHCRHVWREGVQGSTAKKRTGGAVHSGKLHVKNVR
ncbi:MAG: DUF3795 domain-containing protein [Spirochaetota bacterium]